MSLINDEGIDQLIAAICHRAFVDRLSISPTLATHAHMFLEAAFDWNDEQSHRMASATVPMLPIEAQHPMIALDALPEDIGLLVMMECRVSYQLSML